MERHGKLMALIVVTYDPDCLPEKYINCTWWPEDEEHPSDYAWRTRGMIVDAIQNDVTVVTLSEVFFAAIRLAIKEQPLPVDAKLIYYPSVGDPEEVKIDSDGRLDYLPCFNLYSQILRKLL